MAAQNKVRQVTLAQARAAALHAQGLASTAPQDTVACALNTLKAIQLDTISVLARSHELVMHARVDGLTREAIEQGLWAKPPHTFEYWSHAACILPMELYPWFAFRRRHFQRRGIRWHEVPDRKVLNAIRRTLAQGSATATDLGGAKRGGPWWDWSATKIGVEWLLDIGEVVCTSRTGWRRVYSLAPDPGSASPDWVTKDKVFGPTDRACIEALVTHSIQSLGVGTLSDITDVHRLAAHGSTTRMVRDVLETLVEEGRVVPCHVEGWDSPAYASPNAVMRNSTSRTTLLSPFDSLVWNRDRVARLFDMDYRLEAYTPAAKRRFGYFAMPVLHEGRLVARVDPGRENRNRTLVARTVTMQTGFTDSDVDGVATALRVAARWVGASEISIGKTVPAAVSKPLQRRVTS